MPATIEDVARTAGVSTATVSRALRGLPNVAPSTRNRIFQVAEELDYVITPHLSRLISGRRVIGLLAPLVDQWFYAKLQTVIELELINLGYDTVRYSVDTPDNQTDLLRRLASGRLVDGLTIMSLSLSDEEAEFLAKSDLPALTLESTNSGSDSIVIDNVAAAELATRHLINLGHRRIGAITGSRTALEFHIPGQRIQGYLQALDAAGIEIRPELIQRGNFSFEGGAEAMKVLYSVENPPTAVFAISDEMAIGALKTIRDHNLRVPEDVSIIGFDDHDVSAYVDLTTIRQPVSHFGTLAAQMLVERLESDKPIEIRHVVCQPELILRATTGPAPTNR